MKRLSGWLLIADYYHSIEPLDSIMSKMTHREYLTRLAWIDSRWDEPPSRLEWYLMQIAAEVKRLFHKKPNKITTEGMAIRFIRKLISLKKSRPKEESSLDQETLEDRWTPLIGKKPIRSQLK